MGEEAIETVTAALAGTREELTGEAADLLFHLLVLLAAKNIPFADVLGELERREGTSGLGGKGGEEHLMAIDPTEPYDDGNVFARILRGELPSKKVYEDDHAIAFHDIAPQAPVHILVIPKGAYVSWDDFSSSASDAEIAGFGRAIGQVARDAGLVAPGYRVLYNVGHDGGQEVPHLHAHIFGGRRLGRMIGGVSARR